MGAGQSLDANQAGSASYTLEIQINTNFAVENIIELSEQAGKAILDVYNQKSQEWQVEFKDDSSPLTKADRDANSVICDGLLHLTPHIPIVSEENKQLPYSIRKNFQYYWLIDPLDGTKEFLKRNGEFTVNIALIHKQAPVLGVVHVPCTGKTYWAVKGQGAFLRHAGEQRQIKCAEFDLEQEGLSLVSSASHPNKESKEFMDLFKSPQTQLLGSSLKFMMVAEGLAHVYPRFVGTCEWDTAASDIIVREAGGVVLRAGRLGPDGVQLQEDWREVLQAEQPLLYNKEDNPNPAFVAFGKRRPAKQ